MKQLLLNRYLGVFLLSSLLACAAWGQAAAGSNTIDARRRGNADGTVTVQFRGVPGVTYRIESSDTPDASQWDVAAKDLVAAEGWTEWTDAAAAPLAQRLYRVVPQASAGTPVVTVATNVLGTVEDSGLHFLADSNTVQNAQAAAADSWARIKEAGDAGLLVGALGASNHDNAIKVLREYGIAETTLTNMAARLGQPPTRAVLKEKFVRGVVAVLMTEPSDRVKANFKTAAAQGRDRAYWVVKSLGPDWTSRYDQELAQMSVPPIAVLDKALQEVDFIRFFKWYDRNADKVHSVLLNSENLNNFNLKSRYGDANLVMAGMYQLIKARKPDAFVWVQVVWHEDGSDAGWLQALSFKPDGLMIWNLHSFLSPFDRARPKYAAIVGEQTPMMATEFFGFWPQLTTVSDLKPIGNIIDANLDRFEDRLTTMGYCGLMADWRTVQAVSQARQ